MYFTLAKVPAPSFDFARNNSHGSAPCTGVLFDHRQRLAVDDADFEGERIESFDAAKVDAVTVLGVLAVADVRKNPAGLAEVVAQDLLVPEVHAQVAQVVVRREVGGRNVGRRQHRTPADTEGAVTAFAGLDLGAAEREADASAMAAGLVVHDTSAVRLGDGKRPVKDRAVGSSCRPRAAMGQRHGNL